MPSRLAHTREKAEGGWRTLADAGGGQHSPGPTIWPIGFAVGIVCILAGLIVSKPAVAAGVVITVIFGFLWIRAATREIRAAPEADAAAAPAPAVSPAVAATPALTSYDSDNALAEPETERFPRNVFLELTTLGLGGLIGLIVTAPILGFAVLPGFTDQDYESVPLGPMDNFPENQWMIATFFRDPTQGEVSRRTAYIRNNGLLDGSPSFTIISNRCAHLGCPVQPNGLVDDKEQKNVPVTTSKGKMLLSLTPVDPSGFGCPCHGGQYSTEGNRTAGPPVRALDRYEYSIVNGQLVLDKPYSVGRTVGEGKDATIYAYELTGPGQHVDNVEAWLYPIQPPGR
ncbi:MAG: QcrA and Rieske domain-containing protein [Gaiellaceae bacterium]